MKCYMYTEAGNDVVAAMVEIVTDAVRAGRMDFAGEYLVTMRNKIEETHPEVWDTAVREAMWKNIAKIIGTKQTEQLAAIVEALI